MIIDHRPKEKEPPQVSEQCCVPMDRSQFSGIYRERIEKRAARKGMIPSLCFGYGRYEIDGKRYCSRHAGEKALEILLSQQDK